jgi:hypothetical protein
MRNENLLKKAKDERNRYISLLADEIIEKRLAVFVGAGCSMSLGLPSWVDLIEGLLEKYNIKSKERDVFRLASRLERDLGPLKFREKIAARLRVNEIGKSDLHDALVNLDTNLFITTNYDTLLEDYFKLKGISPFIIVNPKDIPSIAPSQQFFFISSEISRTFSSKSALTRKKSILFREKIKKGEKLPWHGNSQGEIVQGKLSLNSLINYLIRISPPACVKSIIRLSAAR